MKKLRGQNPYLAFWGEEIMAYLFRKEINDWPSWATVFQSIDDFLPLIRAIFEREMLEGVNWVSLLTPGTNAVFRVGEYVIKIFAPRESGVNTDADYEMELQSIRRAHQQGIRTPRIIAASRLQDKYLFSYMVMDFIDGQAAGQAFKKFDHARRMQFIHDLKTNMSMYNTKPDETIDTRIIRNRAMTNPRWGQFRKSVKKQAAELIGNLDLSDSVYVHGDLTTDNLILDKNHRLYIIDFADSTIAPFWYEYPPILFDLLDHDRLAIRDFMADTEHNDFIDKLFDALLLHDFGPDFIRDIYIRQVGKAAQDMKNIHEIRDMLDILLK